METIDPIVREPTGSATRPATTRTLDASVATVPVRQAYHILHWGFVLAPTIAGVDKFFDVLVSWQRYLAPQVADVLPVTPATFMQGVGFRPRATRDP